MVLTLLASIALNGSMEAISGGSAREKVRDAIFVIVCAGAGLWALRRYLLLLVRAEYVANQANCLACGEYGRFEVVADQNDQTQVCRRQCAHRWVINSDS